MVNTTESDFVQKLSILTSVVSHLSPQIGVFFFNFISFTLRNYITITDNLHCKVYTLQHSTKI